MADHEVYAQEMYSIRRGLGLFEPNPAGHENFDRVRVGDVGYVGSKGSFYRLFNAFHASEHPINNRQELDGTSISLVPDGFQPLPVNRRETSTSEPLIPGVRKSTGVRQVGVQAYATGVAMGAGARIRLVCERRRGAALITKNIIKCEDAVREKALKEYMLANCDSWHEFAISEGRDIQLHDIILVTGCDLTTDWAMATFNERSSGVEVSFEVGSPSLVVSAGVSLWGKWSSTVEIPYRCGPILPSTESLTDPFNQCVFIRGYRIARRLFWLKKLSAAAEPKDFDGEPPLSDNTLTREIEELGEPRSDPIADIYNVFWDHIFRTTDVDEMVVHDSDIIALIPEDSHDIITDLTQALAVQADLGTTEQPSLNADTVIPSEPSDSYEESITLHRDALELRPPGHPDRSVSLSNLVKAMRTRFEQTGRMEDLEKCIALYRGALDLHPLGHPHHSGFINNLAEAMRTHFEQTGRMEDLEECIALHRDALELRPPGHPDCSVSLRNLGNGLFTRFEQIGRMEDLEEAIVLHRDALEMCPPGHPHRSSSLDNLAVAVRARFEQTGRIEDLEEAIALHHDTLELRPPGHPGRPSSMNNLASAVQTRFKQAGRMEDLEEAIVLHRAALDLRPPGHPDRSVSLSNLGNGLIIRFEQTGRMEDLEEAFVLCRDALELRPPGHPGRPSSMSNLAGAMQTRFELLGRMEDLEESIVLHRDALELRPPGNPGRPSSLNNLAIAVRARFEQTGRMEDLEECIAFHRDALELCLPGHPDRSGVLSNLGRAMQSRFAKSNRKEDLEESLRIYEEGADHVFSDTLLRLEVAVRWAALARSQRHVSTLKAYRLALSLLESSLVITPTVQMQHKILSGRNGYPTLASDAASYAIEIGEVAQAVEMLEQGRALIWSQLRSFRTPIEQLKEVNEGLADRFLTTSRELESLATSSESKSITLLAQDSLIGSSQKHVDEMYARKRRLASQLEDIVAEIRATSGFEDFLRARRFSVLQEAAVEGPVIIISHSDYRSDALIVLYDRPPVSIELDSDFDSLVKDLKTALQLVQTEPDGCDAGISGVMESLWNRVVSRVIEKLDEFGIQKQTRIWWCPTSILSALPFHAAGPIRVVDGIEQYLLDDYISSYTPTLTALINARESKPEIRKHDIGRPQLLVVALPDETIPSIEKEYRAIQKDRDFVKCLVREQATREAVIDNFRDHDWVHIACHGHLNYEEPFLHAFQLFGKDRLTLLDIIQSNLPNAEFAFLSTDHSAGQTVGGAREEVLHLAAAMQFSGFRSVIATMWAMADDDGPFVAKEFYKRIFAEEDSPELGFKRSARALRETIQRLRKRRGMTVERWVNYIHIGA